MFFFKEYSLNITPEFAKNIIKAAPMHDLGKIAVDDAILRKPGKFTPEEYDMMKKHSEEGARIFHEIIDEKYFVRARLKLEEYYSNVD